MSEVLVVAWSGLRLLRSVLERIDVGRGTVGRRRRGRRRLTGRRNGGSLAIGLYASRVQRLSGRDGAGEIRDVVRTFETPFVASFVSAGAGFSALSASTALRLALFG